VHSNSRVPALFQSRRRSLSSESLDPSPATPYLQSRRRRLHSARSAAPFATQRYPTGNWRRRLLESYRTERYRDGDLDGRRFRITLCWILETRFTSYVRESVVSYQWLRDRGVGGRHRSASFSDDGRRNRRPDFGKQLPAGNYNSRGRTRSRDTLCAGGARSSGIDHCSHRRTHLAATNAGNRECLLRIAPSKTCQAERGQKLPVGIAA